MADPGGGGSEPPDRSDAPFEGWRIYLLNAPPGNGVRRYLRKKFPSLSVCNPTISTWKENIFRPSLSLCFRDKDDWEKAESIEFQVDNVKTVYRAVVEKAEDGSDNTDGKSRVIPRIVRTMIL